MSIPAALGSSFWRTRPICGMAAGFFIAALFSSYLPRPQNLILGKWQADGALKTTAEFSRHGIARLTIFGQTTQGSYRFSGADELEWILNGRTTKARVTVSVTELELANAAHQTVVYRKR
jgi:hypothetical protein